MSAVTPRSGSRYSVASARAFAARLVDRAAWYSGGGWERARVSARAALARAGMPIRKEFLDLGCAGGVDASGVFSEVTAVLGCLDHYERHPEVYSGLRVDFGTDGLYYEPAAGPNWWEYYFEPVAIGLATSATRRTVPLWQHDFFAEHTERELSRTAAATLLARYVRCKPVVLDQMNEFWRDQVQDAHAIGVHYRGTDKSEEAPITPYDEVVAAVRDLLPAAGRCDWKLFVATDEQAFVDHMIHMFPGQVFYREVRRSVDGHPIHKTPGGGFQKGLDAIIDCLLLSRCTRIVRTASNLGLVAGYFNPTVPVRFVGRA
jgi:hypothetical protein